MKTKKLMAMTLALAVMVTAAGISLAAGSSPQAASENVSEASDSSVVRQFEQMRDPRTNQRLYYRVSEVASAAAMSKSEFMTSINDGNLCVIRVDGVLLVPAAFAHGYVQQAEVVAKMNSTEKQLVSKLQHGRSTGG